MGQAEVVAAVGARTAEVVRALQGLNDKGLRGPSALPGWSRLTIACHLRFGADAFHRMTRAAMAGEPVSYYPEGREQQRPGTLEPAAGESAADVVTSLDDTSRALQATWEGLGDGDWNREVVEPEGRHDLGPLPLGRLPLLRLTEVEVHGGDLDLGLSDWSQVFVDVTLPFRLEWLNTRRTNHRAVDDRVEGSWLLTATDGPTWRVAVRDGVVDSRPASAPAPEAAADAVVEATSRDLLALLLGRPFRTPPRLDGDVELAASFARAFPGP